MKYLVLLVLAGLVMAGGISPDLADRMSAAMPGDLIPVTVLVEGELDQGYIEASTVGMTRRARQDFVIDALKNLANVSQADVIDFLSDANARNISSFWMGNFIYAEASRDVILEVSRRGDVWYVEYADPEGGLIEPVDRHDLTPEERGRDIAWGVEQINAPDVWSMGYEGDSVIVGVIDTGVDYYHTDLCNNMWHDTPAGEHYGYDFYDQDPDPMDDYGHGTHCAGTVAGDGAAGTETGVAPSAIIMALRIDYYTGGYPTWIDAMEWAADRDADVLTMSLGTSPVGNATLREAEEDALTAGIYHSVAAGNDGPGSGTILASGDCPPPWFHPDQTYHGGTSAVVTAGATDSGDNIASFSSRGPVTWWGSVAPWNDYSDSDPLLDPDISGPGVDIVSTQWTGGYTTMSGTSMATPHLAGTAALIISANPDLSVAQIDSIIEVTSLDLGTAGKDNTYGAGRVDAYEAVLAALELVGTEGETGTAIDPTSPLLSPVRPNPVNSSARFQLTMPTDGNVEVGVYDVYGRSVAVVESSELSRGSHSYLWKLPQDIANGVYLVRATTPDGSSVSRMTVLR
ncbi:S8 family serine peptidase [Candidatus Fermentibacteria bacterium]|nr:S8 family serine peptidase [Candidatus Fermentibacteria bacterium]